MGAGHKIFAVEETTSPHKLETIARQLLLLLLLLYASNFLLCLSRNASSFDLAVAENVTAKPEQTVDTAKCESQNSNNFVPQ